MTSGSATLKAVCKLLVKSFDFIHEIFDIILARVKFWDRVSVFVAANTW